jgi:hypothetical protein
MTVRLIWLALAGAALAAHAAARHRGLPEFHSLASVAPKLSCRTETTSGTNGDE